MDLDSGIRALIEGHWLASERGDIEAEHAIYAADAILDYPQSGERFRSREKISAQRGGHPADRHFTVLRITGGGDLWVSECVITYDGVPSYSVRIRRRTRGARNAVLLRGFRRPRMADEARRADARPEYRQGLTARLCHPAEQRRQGSDLARARRRVRSPQGGIEFTCGRSQ
jgi:hypothetical protein